jgi:hypothetical protein
MPATHKKKRPTERNRAERRAAARAAKSNGKPPRGRAVTIQRIAQILTDLQVQEVRGGGRSSRAPAVGAVCERGTRRHGRALRAATGQPAGATTRCVPSAEPGSHGFRVSDALSGLKVRPDGDIVFLDLVFRRTE